MFLCFVGGFFVYVVYDVVFIYDFFVDDEFFGVDDYFVLFGIL